MNTFHALRNLAIFYIVLALLTWLLLALGTELLS